MIYEREKKSSKLLKPGNFYHKMNVLEKEDVYYGDSNRKAGADRGRRQ